MDAETQAAWDRWADSRIRRMLNERFSKHYDALGQLCEGIGKTIARKDAEAEARMQKRLDELETELKALRSELAVNKTLGDLDERLGRLEAGRPGLRVA